MTPNPNPSLEAIARQIDPAAFEKGGLSNFRQPRRDAAYRAAERVTAALSPQTLPAPGEVEHVLVPRDPTQKQLIAGNEMFHAGEVPLNIYRAMIAAAPSRSITSQGERVQEAFSGVMRAEVVDAGAWSLHLHFGRGDGARDRMRAASSLLASIVTATPTLATVAVANDEGVADLEVLRAAVKNLLPIGNDQLPGDRVIPIYVRMDELRALHALATSRSQHEGAK